MSDIPINPADRLDDQNAQTLPFRFQLRHASDQEVERLNQQHGYKGARKLKPAQQAIEMAEDAQTAVPNRLRSWLEHPDERVVLALLQNENHPWRTQKDRQLIGHILHKRGTQSLQENNNLWNPLLDWAATPAAGAQSYGTYWRNLPHTPGPDKEWIYHDVTQWVSQQTDPDQIFPLLAFGSQSFQKQVAHALQCWNPELLTSFLQRDCEAPLGLNNRLPRQARLFLAQKGLDKMETQLKRLQRGRQRKRDWSANGLLRNLLRDGTGWIRNPGLRSATNPQPLQLQPQHIQHLQQICQQSSIQENRGWGNPGYQAGRLLLNVKSPDHIDEQQLLELYPHIRDNTRVTLSLLKHPSATPKVWKTVLKDSSKFRVREFMTKNIKDTHQGRQNPNQAQRLRKLQKKVLQDPECQEVLRSSQSLDVRIGLFSDQGGTPDEFMNLVQMAAEKNPEQIAKLLSQASDEHLDKLTRDDLLPLLTHKNQQIRSQAVRACQRMGVQQEDLNHPDGPTKS